MNEDEPRAPRSRERPDAHRDALPPSQGLPRSPASEILDLVIESLAPESTQAARDQAEKVIRGLLAAPDWQAPPPRYERPRVRNQVPVDQTADSDLNVDPRARTGRRREQLPVERPDGDSAATVPHLKMTEIVHESDADRAESGRRVPRERPPQRPKRRPNVSTAGTPPAADESDAADNPPRDRRRAPRPTLETGVAESSAPSAPDGEPGVATPVRDVESVSDDAVDRPEGLVEPVVVERSTFGSFPWWERGWWQLTPGGSARDITCDAGTLGSLAAAAVSLRGHKHRLDAAPNDDAFSLCTATALDGSDWLIGCVCDGVGSADRANEGSALVATTFTAELADLVGRAEWADGRPTSETLATLTDVVRARVREVLGVDIDQLREFETTLTFVAVARSRHADGPRRALIGWTGDSPALVLRDGSWVDQGGALAEEATGPTSTRTAGFLTHQGLEGSVQLDLEPDDVIMLCSDGVGAFVTDGTTNRKFGSILASTIAGPVDVLHFVNLINFDMRSADDDRTALVVWQDVRPDDATP